MQNQNTTLCISIASAWQSIRIAKLYGTAASATCKKERRSAAGESRTCKPQKAKGRVTLGRRHSSVSSGIEIHFSLQQLELNDHHV